MQHRVDARRPDSSNDGVDVGESRTGADHLVVTAQHAHESAQLADGVAPRVLHYAEGLPGGERVSRRHHPRRAGLDHHHTHVVRDHVVDLAGDAVAFLGDSLHGTRLLLAGQRVERRRQLLREAVAPCDE